LATLTALTAQVLAQETWTLTDAQFRSAPINLQSIDSAGLHVIPDDPSAPTTLGWSDVLELSRDSESQPAAHEEFALVLQGGDRIDGRPLAMGEQTLQWQNARLGTMQFPLARVAAILRVGAAAIPLDQPRSDDVVRLANGDTTHGIVVQLGPAGVTLQTADANATLPWDSIAAVLFSSSQQPPPMAADRAFRVRLTGDWSITAQGVSLAGDQFTLSFDQNNSHVVPLGDIVAVEQLNGPVSWLTARRPAQVIYKPYFGERFPPQFDRTVDGDTPIRRKYHGFHHGIGCHSYTKIVYDLDGHYADFRTQFAVDSDSSLADVTVRVLLDDKVVFERQNVKAGQVYPVVTVPLGSANKLALEVDYGQNYSTQDRFVWLDPALVQTPPTTQGQ
jgi:hypothetical protein